MSSPAEENNGKKKASGAIFALFLSDFTAQGSTILPPIGI